MNNANKITLGAFVIVSLTLMIVGFLAVGISKVFEPKYKAMTIFNTSVEGLSVGAPVKYMGVPVGRVSRIAMRNNDGFIDIYFDLFPSALDVVIDGEPQEAKPANIVEVMRNRKMSCFLNASGIMSSAHLELSFSDEDFSGIFPITVKEPTGILYVRSKPSHVTNVIQNISNMLDELNKVDMVGLANKLSYTLDNVNAAVQNKDLLETIRRMNSIAQDVEKCVKNLQLAFEESNVRKIVDAIDYLEENTRKLHDAFPQERLNLIAENLERFLIDSRQFIKSTDQSRDDLVNDAVELKVRMIQTMTKFDSTMRDLTEFVNRFEDDPGQLIRGKRTNKTWEFNADKVENNVEK